MIETFSMPFPRQTSKKQRKVYVYLPEGFEPDAAFPVLYMFDGHNVFFDEDATYGKSWGMKEYLENDPGCRGRRLQSFAGSRKTEGVCSFLFSGTRDRTDSRARPCLHGMAYPAAQAVH